MTKKTQKPILIDEDDIDIVPIEELCDEERCEQKATHKVVIDARGVPEYLATESKFCLRHARAMVKKLRAVIGRKEINE